MEILFLEDLIKKKVSRESIFKDIAKLEKEFFPEYPYNIEDIKKACQQSQGNTLLLVDKNKLRGYLIPLLFENKDYLQILTVAVDENCRGKGYGTKLIKKCEEIANLLKLERIVVRVDVSYSALKTFKNRDYSLMKLEDIREFIDEGIFSSEDKIQKGSSNLKILPLFPEGCNTITKDIGKKTPFSFIPMIKNL